jgi:lipid A disaccharide synthetase
MRFGIAAVMAGRGDAGGVETYEQALVRAIARYDRENDFHVFCLDEKAPGLFGVQQHNVKYHVLRPRQRVLGLAASLPLFRERRPNLQFLVARAPGLPDALFDHPLAGREVRVVEGQSHSVVGSAALALVASGTATVETALLGTPMVVVYRLSPLTYFLGRPFVNVPHYAMPNLVADRRIVPEVIQREFTPDRVATEGLRLLTDPDAASRMRQDLAGVRLKLGAPGASRRAAEAVQEFLA